MPGRQWDIAIDVELDNKMLKLCMNNDESPYDAADRFMLDNGVAPFYKQQIVDFILENTGVGSSSK